MTHTHADPAKATSRTHTVSRPHDEAERQADRAAGVVACGGTVSSWSFASVGVSAGASASVHRDEAAPKAEHSLEVAGVERVSSGGGRPLESGVRRSMEARFGYSFGAVRVHDDAQANAVASDVDARAFTIGDHIGFAPGQYNTHARGGQHMLAHELAHVIQQSAGGSARLHRTGATPVVQRVGFFESIARFVGGGTFSEPELTAYLTLIRTKQQIEDANDSDNKARDIVRRFLAHEPAFNILTVPDRVLLIKEMIAGFTGDDDEQAILDLLNEAIPQERAAIVRAVGIDLLRENFHGEEAKQLVASIESGEEEHALSQMGQWTVDGVLDIIERQGDVAVIRDMIRLGWTIRTFQTAFDKWRYDDGRVEEDELTGLLGNTVRERKTIRVRASLTSEQATQTIFHELHHAFAPDPTTEDEYLEDEVQARVAAEQFNIRHGLSSTQPGYRKADGSVDEAFIRREIQGSSHYNPTGRDRIGRRYVGEAPTAGWRVRPTSRGRVRARR